MTSFRRVVSILVTMVLLLSLLPSVTAGAVAAPESDFIFDAATGKIESYRGTGGNVMIPDVINGVQVKTIGQYTFLSVSRITSVTIPAGVELIEEGAFNGCVNLSAIIVDGANAKYASDNGILFNKNKTVLVCYPAGKSGASYNVPSGITKISNSAFNSCANLTTINIPASVTDIGFDSTFNKCSKLASITVDNSNSKYSSKDGVLFDKNQTILTRYPEGKTNTSYAIPDSVIKMQHYAFYNCKNLTSITMSDKIDEIGIFGFYGCSSIRSIKLSSKLAKISQFTFKSCENLTSITIPESVTLIEAGAFSYCTSLESITIPNSVKELQNSVFYNCSSLKSIIIPRSVSKIGSGVFQYCTKLSSVVIQNGVQTILGYAFNFCASLTSIEIPESVTSIGNNAFKGCTNLLTANFLHSDAALITTFGTDVFTDTSAVFAIIYPSSAVNFSTPKWKGYPAYPENGRLEPVNPEVPVTPEEPSIPDEPTIPEEPETPEEPITIEEPNNSEDNNDVIAEVNTVEYEIDYTNELVRFTVNDSDNSIVSFTNSPLVEYCIKVMADDKLDKEVWYPVYGDTIAITKYIPKTNTRGSAYIAIRPINSNDRTVIELKPRADITNYRRSFIYDATLGKIILTNATDGLSKIDYQVGLGEWITNTSITNKTGGAGVSVSTNDMPLGGAVQIRISADPDSATPFASSAIRVTVPKQAKSPTIKYNAGVRGDATKDKITGLKSGMEISTNRQTWFNNSIPGDGKVDNGGVNTSIATVFPKSGAKTRTIGSDTYYVFYVRIAPDTSRGEGRHKPDSAISELLIPTALYD